MSDLLLIFYETLFYSLDYYDILIWYQSSQQDKAYISPKTRF